MTRFTTWGRDIRSSGNRARKETGHMKTRTKATGVVAAAMTVYMATFAIVTVRAQTVSHPTVAPTSLQGLAVPEPPNLAEFVLNRQAAIALGKALFWDMQASSDNVQACASCHFHAGADNRVKNQLDPDLNNVAGAPLSTTFDPTATGNKGGPNYTLKAADFPFHQLQDPADRESIVAFDTNDVAGSAGVYPSAFGRLLGPVERNKLTPDGVFQIGTVETRRVTPRNTPSNINAVLNFRNFWDGRANFVFNGVTPFGPRDTSAQIWVSDDYVDPVTGLAAMRGVSAYARIPYASAASQSVGPILSAFEMSAAGRVFGDIAVKLLRTRPLLYQQVAATDSVLGPYRHVTGYGLNTSYEALIKQAFHPEFWQVPDAAFKASSGQTAHRQIELNFSLFWGLAIQMYETTLISDNSPFDQFASGHKAALTAQQQQGLAIFSSERGRCVNCHKGAEFTGASTRMVLGSGFDSFGGDGPTEYMLMGDKTSAIYDNGFYNIGVAPAGNDVGVGGSDPFGNPLSFAREFKQMLAGGAAPDAMSHSLNRCDFNLADGCTMVTDPAQREAVDGSFKTPSLRNIELTGPYFHTGGYATLEQVVQFYSRGGNVRATAAGDTSGNGPNASNLDTEIHRLDLSADEQAALVAFLKSLTDERVRFERAPFDHPSLMIPNGEVGDNTTLTTIFGRAIDQFMAIPAVGAAGRTTPIAAFSPQ
jgi:cytochrome c peroxidase